MFSSLQVFLLHHGVTCDHFSDDVHRFNGPAVHVVHVIVKRVAVGQGSSVSVYNGQVYPCKDNALVNSINLYYRSYVWQKRYLDPILPI